MSVESLVGQMLSGTFWFCGKRLESQEEGNNFFFHVTAAISFLTPMMFTTRLML